MNATTEAVSAELGAGSSSGKPLDRDFIEKNRLFERYLVGSLPLKGALELEEACRRDPSLLSTNRVAERVARAVTLLEHAGRTGEWLEKPKRWWEHPALPAGLAAAVLALAVLAGIFFSKNSNLGARNERLAAALAALPVEPSTSRRVMSVKPNRSGVPARPMFGIGSNTGGAEFVELKLDLSWSKAPTYRISIERDDQGAIAVLHHLLKDSNGEVRLALNSGALGPGPHSMTIEGVQWNGRAETVGGVSFEVQRRAPLP